MAMRSEPTVDTDLPEWTADRRLHPLSWFFVLLQQLRSFAIPLVVLVATGRGGQTLLVPLAGVGGLVVVSVVRYLSYRYRAEADGLVITSGVLQRTNRDIPYERIHTVNVHQTLLHRLFNVAEVRLEAAGGKEAEAVMRVLSLDDARGLEQLLRVRSASRRGEGTEALDSVDATAGTAPLLALSTSEIVRLGLISNRGMVVVAAVVGALWQFADDIGVSRDRIPSEVLVRFGTARDFLAAHLHDVFGVALIGLLVLVPAIALVRALSVVLALLQYYGFTVREAGRQLQVTRGLLTRIRHQLPKRRIQAWRVDETLLHRWFGRQTLRVDNAAGSGDDEHAIRQLAPVATPDQVAALINHMLPSEAWPPETWSPVDRRAWRRLFVVPVVVLSLTTMVAATAWGPVALLLLGAAPLVLVRARAMGRFAGYVATDCTVSVRGGWLSRNWGRVEVRKLQALRLTQSPFDRRLGMATLWLDTAGASASDGILRIRFLPEAEARQLYGRLATLMAGPRASAAPASV